MHHVLQLSWTLLVGFITSSSSMIQHEYGPQNVTVTQGQDALFECKVINKGKTMVEWYWASEGTRISRDWRVDPGKQPAIGQYLIEGNPMLGEVNLIITNVQPVDAGRYQCGFESMGYVSLGAHLTVLVPPQDGYPECVQELQSNELVVGSTLQLMCMSHGGSPPAQLTWSVRNQILTEGSPFTNSLHTQLTLSDLSSEFICSAESPALSQARTCSIRIQLTEPSVNIRPLALTASVGESVTYMCTRQDKRSESRFKWRYKGNDVTESSSSRFNVSANNRAFTINPVIEADSGAVVECVVSVLPDLNYSASGMLKVMLLTGEELEPSKPRMLQTEHSTLPATTFNATYGNMVTGAGGMVASNNGQTSLDVTPMIIVLGAGGGLLIVILALVINCTLIKRAKKAGKESKGNIKPVSSGSSLVSKKETEKSTSNLESPKTTSPCKKEINSNTNRASKPTSQYLELNKTGVTTTEYQGLNSPPMSIYAEPNVPPSRIVPRPQHQESFHDYALPDEYVEPDPPPRNKQGKEAKQNADGLYIEIIA